MGIGGVGDYTGILQNYKVPVIPGAALGKDQTSDIPVQAAAVSAAVTDSEALSAVMQKQEEASRRDTPEKGIRPEDISLTLNRQKGSGHIGRDSDIRSLDVERAIDDMKKDKILQQYQYFVGSSRNLYSSENTDGIVVQKL